MASPDLTGLIDDPLPFLEHPDPAIRRVAVSACFDRLADPEAFASVAALAQHDDSAVVRAEAIEVLASCGRRALDLALAACEDDDFRVVEAAATALGEIASPAALPWLIEAAAAHADRLVREAAVASLGAIGDDAALPVLLEVVASGPPQVRRRAVVALTVFDDPAVEPALVAARDDRNPMVREVAEMVVGRRRPEWAGLDLRTDDA